MKKYRQKNLLVLLIVAILAVIVGITVYAAQPTVSWGSRGNGVMILQRKLRDWGYYDGSIDGVYGQDTYHSVVDFQRKNRLRVDGVVGPETWAALGYRSQASSGGNTAAAAGASGVSRNNDLQLLARAIYAEARGEPYEGQVAVGAVLLNRVQDPAFPNSINGVVYQPLAFESVANGQINLSPNSESVRAARSALNGWDPTHGCTFFWNPSKPVNEWIWSRQIVRRIGSHVFAR